MRMAPELAAVRVKKKPPFEQEETLSRPRLLQRYPPERVKETERSGVRIFIFLCATLLSQRRVYEFGRVPEEGPQVEVFAVRSLHAVVLYVGVAVEPRPRVDVLGAVGGVQHVRYPQVH